MGNSKIAYILDVAVNEKKSMLASRRDIAEAQAEISFKAGIREVVEWVNSNIYFTDTQNMPRLFNKWKAKLKEWRVE